MMKLKGEMLLELTDSTTGDVETVKETNMVTQAVNDILGNNPMGFITRRVMSTMTWFSGMGIFSPSVRI